LGGLSLAVGVCVAELLHAFELPQVRLKWPNDLLWENYKIGGILIEIAGDASGPCDVVIGIGLNINNRQAGDVMRTVDQPWTDLASISADTNNRLISRNAVAAGLIESLCRRLPEFEAQGFAAFAEAYYAYDALRTTAVVVSGGNENLEGIADGVDHEGCLRLKTADGGLRQIRSGEVSLRIAAAGKSQG
ncbi:MAG TPA: biotin--[acetyl-CoA-carboxylase] ligase, partial [Gammaproteobacteria bacterium]